MNKKEINDVLFLFAYLYVAIVTCFSCFYIFIKTGNYIPFISSLCVTVILTYEFPLYFRQSNRTEKEVKE